MSTPARTSTRHASWLCAACTLASAALTPAALAQSFTFAPPVTRACTPQHSPTRVVPTDVDQDSALDLLLPGRDKDGLMNWVPLSAQGVPGTMQSFVAGGQSDAAVVGDFNHDGLPDLACVFRAYAGKLAVFLRGDDGLATEPVLTPMDREPRSLVAGDWNGDAILDLAATQYGNQALLVLRGVGDGTFQVSQRVVLEPWSGGPGAPQEVVAGDLNNDGRTDLVVGMLGTRRVDVLLAQPDGSFGTPVAWMSPDINPDSRPGLTTITLGDMDNDGDLDIAAALIMTGGNQPFLVFLNDGQGGFAERQVFAGPDEGYNWACTVGDLDLDGDLDVVLGTALPGALLVLENTMVPGGPLTFAPPQQIGTANFVRDIAVVNVDGDCDPDLVFADIAANTVRVYRQLRSCTGLVGSGAGGSAGGSSGSSAGAAADSSAAARSQPALLAMAAAADRAAWAARGRQLAARAADGSALAVLLSTIGGPPDLPVQHTLMGQDASCGPDGPGGRCDEPHLTPGCFTTPCCERVCGIAPDCCVIAWDDLCVTIAEDECAGLVCPQYGACDTVHADPGCEDPACCQLLTRLDGYCREATWDHICVERAAELCGTAPCVVTPPAGALLEPEICYQHLNDGPNVKDDPVATIECGQSVYATCTSGGPRDTDWYLLPGQGQRRVVLQFTSEFPCEIHLVRGTFAGPLRCERSVWGGLCTPVTLDACLDDAPWYAVVSMGTPAGGISEGQPCTEIDPENPPNPDDPPIVPGYYGVHYLVQLQCTACGLTPDLDHSGVVDGVDLGLLLGAWGTTGADLDGDGTTNGTDLGLLLGAWGPVAGG